jgi:hypothetical protein
VVRLYGVVNAELERIRKEAVVPVGDNIRGFPEGSKENSVRTVCVPAKFRTENPLIVSLQCYFYTTLLGTVMIMQRHMLDTVL